VPRPYHSPSSIATGKRCQRAWAYQYIAGMRDPEVPWHESWATALPEGITPRMRSTALGKAMHKVGEAWYRQESVDWSTFPATVFLSGAHLLPHPDRVHTAMVEQPIGDLPHLVPVNEHAPPTALEVHGVRFAGYKDLVVYAPAELDRLHLAGEWLLVDYKSTASVARYALTPAALLEDVQCNLYALDILERTGQSELGARVPARWVYFETKRKRQALPVDVTVTRAHALRVLEPAAELARELDAIETVDDAAPNPDACEDYGGCTFHQSRGGPCNARRSLGLQIARATKGRLTNMNDAMKAKLEELKAKAAGGTTETEDPNTSPGANQGAADAPPTAKPARGRPASKAKAPAGSLAETMSGLCDELTAAEALVSDVRRRMSEALA
jgi:hypothetical protein